MDYPFKVKSTKPAYNLCFKNSEVDNTVSNHLVASVDAVKNGEL